MVNIVNYGTLGGGFRHYAGLQPLTPASGDPQSRASVRNFHLDPTNAAAIFRGDIITYADSTHGVQGGGDQPYNLSAPSSSPVIGGGGGTGLGNASMTPNAARWVPGDTTSVIVGACVGFGSITLYQAKNGFQYVPASTEAWLSVETDKSMEYAITAGNQSTRFGISGVSLDPALATTSTLPLRVLNSGEFIGNDPTAAGFVAKVQFNSTRMTGFVAD
jgi:hypothetical protein